MSLFPPSEQTPTSLSLFWSISYEDDFAAYTLLRGESPGISSDAGTIVTSTDDSSANTFVDSGLSPDTNYYYRVVVTDTDGMTSLSNEIEASTAPAAEAGPPEPVTLYPPAQATTTSLSLAWTSSQDADFHHYAVLRGDAPGVTLETGVVLAELDQASTVTLVDTGLSPDTTYHYVIAVADTEGLSSLSNEVGGATLAGSASELPTPVMLGAPYNISQSSLSLSWTQSTDSDFARYELYRSQLPGISTDDALLVTYEDATLTSFEDTDLVAYRQYFYRVWVYNSAGQSIPSNEVSATTMYDAPPAAVMLEEPSEITGTSMVLEWELSRAIDFKEYRLYRSLAPDVDEDSTLIYQTPDQNSLSFIDDELLPNTTYYYRVYVVDTWNISTGGNIVDGTTTNTEAPRCAIERSHTWKRVGGVFDFTAVGCADNETLPADIEVRWNFGDGSDGTEYGLDREASHSYAERGVYWVELWAFDGRYSSVTRAPVIAGEVEEIPGDDFTMGRDLGSIPWPSMRPERTVSIAAFFMGTYEVTNAEYAAFLSDGNADQYWVGQQVVDNLDGTYDPEIGLEEIPISGGNWFNAVAFCEWIGMRLPTEAEWEYAARGPTDGTNYHFPWGNELPAAVYPPPANYANLVGDRTAVGSYANGVTAWDDSVALYDMAGNATEWVHDLYDPNYYEWANNNDANDNPTGPAVSPYVPGEPAYRVTRGGGFSNDDNPLRVSFRTFHDPVQRGMGFRCATNTIQ